MFILVRGRGMIRSKDWKSKQKQPTDIGLKLKSSVSFLMLPITGYRFATVIADILIN